MADRGWFNGAVALVLEGFGSITLLKPMPQRRWTRPDPPQRPEACLLRGWIRLRLPFPGLCPALVGALGNVVLSPWPRTGGSRGELVAMGRRQQGGARG